MSDYASIYDIAWPKAVDQYSFADWIRRLDGLIEIAKRRETSRMILNAKGEGSSQAHHEQLEDSLCAMKMELANDIYSAVDPSLDAA